MASLALLETRQGRNALLLLFLGLYNGKPFIHEWRCRFIVDFISRFPYTFQQILILNRKWVMALLHFSAHPPSINPPDFSLRKSDLNPYLTTIHPAGSPDEAPPLYSVITAQQSKSMVLLYRGTSEAQKLSARPKYLRSQATRIYLFTDIPRAWRWTSWLVTSLLKAILSGMRSG